MAAKRHPNKHVREVIEYAESRGWTFVPSGRSGHRFGTLRCPAGFRGGCSFPVYSTPRNVESHSRRIREYVDACPHTPLGA